jgi:hypothetical protein
MNASLVISVTFTVLAVAVAIAVFFKIYGDNAADHSYKVSFRTHHFEGSSRTDYAEGHGTIVVNDGVQSFTYTDVSFGKTTVTLQEESGIVYRSSDEGATFVCAGDVGGVNYASATPQNVATSLVEIPEEVVKNLKICDDNEKGHAVNAFETDWTICSSDGIPSKVISGNHFEAFVESFDVRKDGTHFDPITVPVSAEVNIDFCEDVISPQEECAIESSDIDDNQETTIMVTSKCCNALNAWDMHSNYDSDMAIGDCEAFSLCVSSCGDIVKGANFGMIVIGEDEEFGDPDLLAAGLAGNADLESFCALQDIAALAQGCEDSGNRVLEVDDSRHWRDRINVKVEPKMHAKPKIISKEERKLMRETGKLEHEERELRIKRINRRRLVEKYGENFHRHLQSSDVEAALNQKNVCFMHGMGGVDHEADEYWGVEHYASALSELSISGVDPDTQVHYISTNSKYCDFWGERPSDETAEFTSGLGTCTDAELVSQGVLDTSGQVDDAIPAGKRGSLPSQFKTFIDHHQCNIIFAHSMGNPTMAEVYNKCRDDDNCDEEKYQWYDTQGPIKGSTAAGVVVDYSDETLEWKFKDNWFSMQGLKVAAINAIVGAMGYDGQGELRHNALHSMVPHDTKKWSTNDDRPDVTQSCFMQAFQWSSVAKCPPYNSLLGSSDGGKHLIVHSAEDRWYPTTYKKVWKEIKEKKSYNHCSGKWWSWFCYVKTFFVLAWDYVDVIDKGEVCRVVAECEDAGKDKVDAIGVIGALCGAGEGYGLGVGNWMGFGESNKETGGDLQNLGLVAIHYLTDYGEKSDGMVGWTSCSKPLKNAGRASEDDWSGSPSSKWYKGDMSHLDGTGFSGDGALSSQQPNKWFAEMTGKQVPTVCNGADWTYQGYGCEWLRNNPASLFEWCSHYPTVQTHCECECARNL